MQNIRDVDILMECLKDVLENRNIDYDYKELLSDNPKYIKLYDSLFEIRDAIIDIGKGELSNKIVSKGYLPGIVKNLQSTLKHLMWQTKAIALGDFTQNVDFLGEFSDAFNTMTEQVEVNINMIKNLEIESKEAKEHFEAIFDTSPDMTIISNQQGIILEANRAFFDILRYEKDEVIGKSYMDVVFFKNTDNDLYIRNEIRNKGECKNLESILITKDKKALYVLSTSKIIEFKSEVQVISVFRDITERRNMEQALKESEEKYRLLTEFTSDVIWVLNLKLNRFTYISPSIYNLRGITSEESMQEELEDTLSLETRDYQIKSLQNTTENFIKNPLGHNSYTYEIQQPHKDGSTIWVEVSTKYRYSDKGEIEIVGVSRNIDKRKKSEERVIYLSYHDQLTGLYNRRFYDQKLALIDTEENLPISLVMGDVNGLKLTNDAFGHIAGDTLLSKVAEVFKSECKESDVISRTGGDEFVILLPNTDSVKTEELVRRIKKSLSEQTLDNMIVSVSFGWDTKSDVDKNICDLYPKAEEYMYQEKLSESKAVKKKTIELIVKNIYEKDDYAETHGDGVRQISKKIGQALGLDKDSISNLGLAGLVHDIGKIGIAKEILMKPGCLNEAEWQEIKRHPEVGYQILRSTGDYSNIAEYVLSHHECLDGTGYPRGIKDFEISIYARILAIADAYDAMTNDRVYRYALSEEQVIKEIKKDIGTKFDENIARVFVEEVLGKLWDEY